MVHLAVSSHPDRNRNFSLFFNTRCHVQISTRSSATLYFSLLPFPRSHQPILSTFSSFSLKKRDFVAPPGRKDRWKKTASSAGTLSIFGRRGGGCLSPSSTPLPPVDVSWVKCDCAVISSRYTLCVSDSHYLDFPIFGRPRCPLTAPRMLMPSHIYTHTHTHHAEDSFHLCRDSSRPPFPHPLPLLLLLPPCVSRVWHTQAQTKTHTHTHTHTHTQTHRQWSCDRPIRLGENPPGWVWQIYLDMTVHKFISSTSGVRYIFGGQLIAYL